MAEINPEKDILRKSEKSGFKWVVKPGKRIFVEDQKYGDKQEWHAAEVEEGHIVTVEGERIISSKGGGKVGMGLISSIKEGSFYSGDTLVSVGKRVKIFFPKKETVRQPQIPKFPKIPIKR